MEGRGSADLLLSLGLLGRTHRPRQLQQVSQRFNQVPSQSFTIAWQRSELYWCFFFTPPILVILNRDTLIVAFGNCLTSVFAGFVIFSYLGYLANFMDLPVGDVAKSGPSLTFVVYPFAVTKMPISPLWAILFFIMLITLGVDSEVSRYFLLLYTQIFLPFFPPFLPAN